MHIAIISPFPPSITGIGQYGYHITRTLANSGLFSRITVLAGSFEKGHHPDQLGTTEVDYCWMPGQFKVRKTIVNRIKELNPDLVWFNLGVSMFGKSPWVNISGLLTPRYVKRLGIPTVVTLHELIELANLNALDLPGGPIARWGAQILTDIATQVDIVCLTMRHYAERLSSRLPGANYLHIPHGAFDSPEILPESDSPELLFFSTLAPFKRLDVLLEAFGILRWEFPGLKLTVAGVEHIRYPHYARQIRAKFKNLKSVTWLGEVQEEDLRAVFQRAQVVILPYQASTGSSSVLVRAATWGRSVIVSDLPEIQTFVCEMGLNVTFFEAGNVLSLTEKLRVHLDSKEIRQKQAIHNLTAVNKNRLEVIRYAYISAFNLAFEVSRSPKRIKIPSITSSGIA